MQKARKTRVRLADIAKASGVSLTAVSLALSDKPGISQDTRDRVLHVAQSMGYLMKTPVSPLKANSFNTLALLVKSGAGDEPHTNQFYAPIISGIELTARQMGISLLFAHLPVDANNAPLEKSNLLEKSEVDGLILMGVLVDDTIGQILEHRGNPVILVDSYAPGRQFNSVLMDNEPGAYAAIESLILKGHRHIGFIGGHEEAYPSLRDRRSGFTHALSDYHLPSVHFADCSFNREEISAATIKLLMQYPEITAVMGVNDDTAITAMFALIEAGYRIPQDVSVIGFDDIYLSETVKPSLTTMSINKHSMGRMAVQMLINQAFQTEGCTVNSLFRPILVERKSVAKFCAGA